MTESTLPAPLTPADCDLRGYGFMPLYGDRLFTSATWIAAKPEAKVAALRLWFHSFAKEVPAASLPDDDTLLSEYAGYGVAITAWRKVKTQALRKWIKCSDGRLYHETLAEIALKSWKGRKDNQGDTERKQREREDRARMFADLDAVGEKPPWNIPTGELRDMHRLRCPDLSRKSVTGERDRSGDSHVTPVTNVTAREGEGEGEGEDVGVVGTRARETPSQRVIGAANHPFLDPNKSLRLVTEAATVAGWIAAGADLEAVIIPTVIDALSTATEPVSTWNFFTTRVRRNAARHLAAQQPQRPITPEQVHERRDNDRRIGAHASANRREPGDVVSAGLRLKARLASQGSTGSGELDSGSDAIEPEHETRP